MRELDALISEYQHDKFRSREGESLLILQKVASLVKPIMRQRHWSVHTLAEFYPSETNLLGLNINRGEKICLRLRYPGDERQFLPIEQVVDTMLHELCHNEIGPHNKEFHALWDQLRDEHESLLRKGYTGEGFLSNGKRLGGRAGIPKHEATRLARARADAAERRRTLSAGSGQKLGGAPVLRGTDIRKVIADAAERRSKVTNGCASGTQAASELDRETTKNGFTTKAEEDDANEHAIMLAYIDLVQEEENKKYGSSYQAPTPRNPLGPRRKAPPPPVSHASNPHISDTLSGSKTVGSAQEAAYEDDCWTCPVCTLENPWNYLCCDACTTERSDRLAPPPKSQSRSEPPRNPIPTRSKAQTPSNNRKLLKARSTGLQDITAVEKQKIQQGPVGWICHECGNFMENEWWTCAQCGTMKQRS